MPAPDSPHPLPAFRSPAKTELSTVQLETDLNGYVAFSVTVDPQGTSFTVEEETPPACATAPEPQTTQPLMAGDLASLDFSTQDNPGCGLGTIALYAMACPDGFTGPADDYTPWRERLHRHQRWNGLYDHLRSNWGDAGTPLPASFGIPGRAPVVGLPAGDYTIQQNGDTPASVFCLVYDTANYASSPEPSAIVPVPLTDGVGTVSLSGNRLSCDLFTAPGGSISSNPTAEVIDPAASATLDVHLSQCPEGYVPTDTIYDDCHGNGLAGIPVQLSSSNGFSGTIATTLPETPGPGVASFANLDTGTYTIGASIPSDTSVLTYCSDDAFVEVPATFDDAARTLSLDLTGGQIVTCDWYVIPTVGRARGGDLFSGNARAALPERHRSQQRPLRRVPWQRRRGRDVFRNWPERLQRPGGHQRASLAWSRYCIISGAIAGNLRRSRRPASIPPPIWWRIARWPIPMWRCPLPTWMPIPSRSIFRPKQAWSATGTQFPRRMPVRPCK